MLGPQEPEPEQRGMMVYPDRGWRWLLFRLPYWLWRMGFAPVMRGRLCMLTTRGRKSGKPRDTLLEYAQHDGRAYLLAGWGPRSHWVRNLLADPRATLVSGLGTQRGRAVRVEDPEIARALYPDLRKSPVWDDYTLSLGRRRQRHRRRRREDRPALDVHHRADGGRDPEAGRGRSLVGHGISLGRGWAALVPLDQRASKASIQVSM